MKRDDESDFAEYQDIYNKINLSNITFDSADALAEAIEALTKELMEQGI